MPGDFKSSTVVDKTIRYLVVFNFANGFKNVWDRPNSFLKTLGLTVNLLILCIESLNEKNCCAGTLQKLVKLDDFYL